MKLYICDSKGEMLKITIEAQKTISELKEKIKELKYVKDEIILCFNGKMLENSKTIEESNLTEENILSFLGNFVPHKNN
jgi:hypothetical protein